MKFIVNSMLGYWLVLLLFSCIVAGVVFWIWLKDVMV